MIHGDGVSGKYSVILNGYRAEVVSQFGEMNIDKISDMIVTFIHMIRSCTHSEFDEWYQLYKK